MQPVRDKEINKHIKLDLTHPSYNHTPLLTQPIFHILHSSHIWKCWSISARRASSACHWDWQDNPQRPTMEGYQEKRGNVWKNNMTQHTKLSLWDLSYHHKDKGESNEDVSHGKWRHTRWDEEGQTNTSQTDERHGKSETQEGLKGRLQP